MKSKTISIVWWGIWWLATAILLARQGHKVAIYEKNECRGGRASIFSAQWYTFDMGPSRYLMPDLFEKFFNEIGENIHDHLDLQQLSPSYRVFYSEKVTGNKKQKTVEKSSLQHLDVYADIDRMAEQFETMEAGSGAKFRSFLQKSWEQYEIGMEFALRNYDSIFDFFRWDIAWKGMKLNIWTSIDKYVARFFKTPIIQKIMQYTTVFLGTAPRDTPAFYNIMSHVDFAMGVWYPQGWLHQIAKVLVEIGEKYGVEYHLNHELTEVISSKKQVESIQLKRKDLTKKICFHGIGKVGTGKSTVISYIWKKLGIVEFNTDFYHKNIFEHPWYSAEEQKIVNDKIEKDIRAYMESWNSFSLQCFWVKRHSRFFVKTMVEMAGYEYVQICTEVNDEEILKKRIEQRFNLPDRDSDGDRNVYLKLKELRWERLEEDGFLIHNNWTLQELEQQVDAILDDLQSKNIQSDHYVINADQARFETTMLSPGDQTYPQDFWKKKTFAPSGFIIYAGIDKQLANLQHHNLYFNDDRNKSFGDIFDRKLLPDDPSLYICAPSKTDPNVAPAGKENLFILVPIPNGIEISAAQKSSYRDRIWKIVEAMAWEELLPSLEYERIFEVQDFKDRYNARNGTALGLGHTIMQTASFRPNNYSKKLDNLFYVGHNTNPGIGVPMVLASAMLVVERMRKRGI